MTTRLAPVEVAAINASNAVLRAARAQKRAAEVEEESARKAADTVEKLATTASDLAIKSAGEAVAKHLPPLVEQSVPPLVEVEVAKAYKASPPKDGVDGRNGVDGKAGKAGTNGKDGVDGKAGTPGIDGAGPDEQVRISATDPVAGFLADKLQAGNGVKIRTASSKKGDRLVIDVTSSGGGVGGSAGIVVLDDGAGGIVGNKLSFDGGDPITSSGGIIHVPVGSTGGSDDQTAAEVPFTPAGSISATNVQAAIEEVAAEAGTGEPEFGFEVGPELVTGDDQDFAGETLGGWTAPEGGTLETASSSSWAGTQSGFCGQFTQDDADETIRLTVTGPFTVGHRYVAVVVFEGTGQAEFEVNVNFGGDIDGGDHAFAALVDVGDTEPIQSVTLDYFPEATTPTGEVRLTVEALTSPASVVRIIFVRVVEVISGYPLVPLGMVIAGNLVVGTNLAVNNALDVGYDLNVGGNLLSGGGLEINGDVSTFAKVLAGTVDPSAGAGVSTNFSGEPGDPPGLYIRDMGDGSTQLWTTTGVADTDWAQVGTGGTPAVDPGAPPAVIADPTLATAEDVALAYNDLQAWAEDLRNAMLAAGSLA